MSKILFILCASILFFSCGNNDAEERSKKFRIEGLNDFIKRYSTHVDTYCACVDENRANPCDDEYQSILVIKKAMDVSLAACNDKLDFAVEEYKSVKKEINGISEKFTGCLKTENDRIEAKKYGIELHDENADAKKVESIIKTDKKVNKIIEAKDDHEEDHHDEEEEHHHD